MSTKSGTAIAYPNIAFIKYWGIIDPDLIFPANGSISMNLAGLASKTTVTFDPGLDSDHLILNGQVVEGAGFERAVKILDRVRELARIIGYAHITSENNFPTGSGIASSASGFAALALASSAAAGLELSEDQLSRLARLGSGSACRSIPGGFVEWTAGDSDQASFARTIAPPGHWDLVDCIAIISQEHKPTGSLSGHGLASTSSLQAARVADTPRRLDFFRKALFEKDFAGFAEIVELDSNLMHAVMMTSTPNLIYWQPPTLAVMQAVKAWRQNGIEACYTIDAGPNVHVICTQKSAAEVAQNLASIPGVQKIMTATPGGPAQLIQNP